MNVDDAVNDGVNGVDDGKSLASRRRPRRRSVPLRGFREGWRWYAVAAPTWREPVAARHLQARRFDVFLPLERYAKRINDRSRAKRVREKVRPLFPGYLFVRLDLARPWASVLEAPCVRSFVVDGAGLPVPVRPGDIEQLRARQIAEGGAVRRLEPLQLGDRVEIGEGLLRDQRAIVDGLFFAGAELRVLLALDSGAGSVKVSLTADAVRRVAD